MAGADEGGSGAVEGVVNRDERRRPALTNRGWARDGEDPGSKSEPGAPAAVRFTWRPASESGPYKSGPYRSGPYDGATERQRVREWVRPGGVALAERPEATYTKEPPASEAGPTR